jgi:hypothetical protein
MKFLHILRSQPCEITRRLIQETPGTCLALDQGAVDYDRLVAEIFGADRVICWW